MMFGTLTRIVSGGQTGADRGALNAARALSLPIGGWAPQGWRASDGCIPLELRQHMRESVSPNYGLRTRLNVQDSDGTLILSFASTLTGESKFTVIHVKRQRKPCKHLVLPRGSGVVPGEVTAALWDWIEENRIAVLNVAGPRESKERGIQAAAERVIRDLLEAKHRSTLMAAMAFGDANADAQTAAQKKLYPEDMADTVRYAGLPFLGLEFIDEGAIPPRTPKECGCGVNGWCARHALFKTVSDDETGADGEGPFRLQGKDLLDFIDDMRKDDDRCGEFAPPHYAPKRPDSDDLPGVTHWAPDGGQLCDYDSSPDDQLESIRFSRVDCMGCLAVGEKYPDPVERYDVADPPVPTPTLDEFVAMLNEDTAPTPQDGSQVEADPSEPPSHCLDCGAEHPHHCQGVPGGFGDETEGGTDA